MRIVEPPRWLTSILLFRWLAFFFPRNAAGSVWYRAWQGGDWYKLRPMGASFIDGFWTDHLPDPETATKLVIVEEEHYGF